MKGIERDALLTAADVPGFPNGTATVYRVATNPQHTAWTVAALDDAGYLRSLDDDRTVFDAEVCEVLEVEA